MSYYINCTALVVSLFCLTSYLTTSFITWLIDVSRDGSWNIRYHNHTV